MILIILGSTPCKYPRPLRSNKRGCPSDRRGSGECSPVVPPWRAWRLGSLLLPTAVAEAPKIGTQELRKVRTPGSQVIPRERIRHHARVLPQDIGGVFENPLGQVRQADAVAPSDLGIQPLAPGHESSERGFLVPPIQGSGLDEVSTVCHQVPIAGKPAQTLHSREIDQLVL